MCNSVTSVDRVICIVAIQIETEQNNYYDPPYTTPCILSYRLGTYKLAQQSGPSELHSCLYVIV